MTGTFANYPDAAQPHLTTLRAWILEEAERVGAAPLTETTKWGQPSFLTEITKSGTTIRLAWSEKAPQVVLLLVHCQTTLVETWRQQFPDLSYDGNRAVHVPLAQPLPEHELRACIAQALTYHRVKS